MLRGVRRLLLGLLALDLVVITAGHLVAPAPAAPPPGAAMVGLVFDVGGRGDKSFNDAAWRGLARARDELGVAIRTVEPGDDADREGALRWLAARGARLVIAVGYVFSRDLDQLAAEFPDTAFAGVDYAPSGAPMPPNLLALRFREHEGSFVVGAIAGLVAADHHQKVGFVGGMTIPLIRKFEAGYTAGVHHTCPACEVLTAYAGADPKAFADPTRGAELASAQYGGGADVIFHAAGKTGSGVFAVARERGTLAIGVDSDQHDEAPCCVLTSMVKRIDVAVVEAARTVLDGTFEGGIRELGLAEDGVGFVADERNRGLLSPEIEARARAIAADVVSGAISVPDH